MTAQTAMGWVVVEDPIPAGASIIGHGLQRDSQILTAGDKKENLLPIFEEAGRESYRAYYQQVPSGQWSLEYTVRFNTSGTFLLPPSRVEAMYAPELYAEQSNAGMTILEASP